LAAELLAVVAGVGDLVVDDELELVVDRALDIVANGVLLAFTQGASVGVGARELRLTAVLQLLELRLLARLALL
jgi:hypothetical protein